ncbi:MAG: hypothetical protein LBT31_07430 [Synergistaceae bacterium]|jgi:hypothetical protein|nr:hypothetical protein [Synergistaceae bacterium]
MTKKSKVNWFRLTAAKKRLYEANPSRRLAAFILALFMFDLCLPAIAGAAHIGGLSVRAPLKSEVADAGADKVVEAVKKANVLFLVESTAAMSFSPKGVMPIVVLDPKWRYGTVEAANWTESQRIYGYGFNDIQRMMVQSTFGMGALPTAWSGLSVRKERNLYGRDIDSRNNYVKTGRSIEEDLDANKDRYYFPFADSARANALREAYSGQHHELETSFSGAVRPKRKGKEPYAALEDEVDLFLGTSKSVNYGYNKLSKSGGFPYALVFKNPKYWQTGWTESIAPTADDLVPNDSRMYQAKLALWRLLQDESLFSGIRIGLATTFLSPINTSSGYPNKPSWAGSHAGANDRTDFNTIFRVSPFGGNLFTQRYFDSKNGWTPANYWDYTTATSNKDGMLLPPSNSGTRYQTLQYKNGILLMNVTGHPSGWEGMHAQLFPAWANSQVATNYSMDNDIYGLRDGWSATERMLFKLENRASLHVPIADYDYLWQKSYNYKKYEIKHADKIRLWINGLVDIKSAGPNMAFPFGNAYDAKSFASNIEKEERNSQFHFYKDPEIGIAGTFALPNAIFPDPNPNYDISREKTTVLGSKSVWYSDATSNTNYLGYLRAGTANKLANPKAFFNAGSGEAAGAVIDFFSPHIYYNMAKEDTVRKWEVANTKAIDNSNLTDLSFPIRNACEDNWLVVIASGMEVEPVDGKSYRYNSWDAIKNLYDYTDRNNPRRGKATMSYYKWDPNEARTKRSLRAIDLDKPIRTLVVGIAADPEDPEIAADPVLKNQVIKVRENLNRMARAGQGADPFDQNSDVTAFFADNVPSLIEAIREAMLFINDFPTDKSGKGSMPKSQSLNGNEDSMSLYSYNYRAMRTNQWEGALSRFEASRSDDAKLRLRLVWELGKNIASMRGRRNLRYWSGSKGVFVPLAYGDPNFKRLTGLDARDMGGTKIQLNALLSFQPHDALYKWLQGYDHSYARGMDFERSSMFSDIGQSGIVYVEDPTVVDSLPGHREWAENMKVSGLRQPPRIYLQTNDGILHIVDPIKGEERAAILPPPVLMPSRLATLKTRMFENKLEWIDVLAPEGGGKLRSNPIYTLDGPLVKRNIDMAGDGRGWGSFILGTLGRGGSGLYMLDVSSRDDPKFMWYRERIDADTFARMESNWEQPGSEKKDALDPSFLPFMKIGLNSPKPAMGVTGPAKPPGALLNFIALPGGVQSKVDLAKNGSEGAVLLIVDAKQGRVLRAFDSAAFLKVDGKWRAGKGEVGKAPYMGMMVSEPTLYRSDTNPYLTGRLFASDNRGNIFCVFMEEKDWSGDTKLLPPDRWYIRTVATLQKDGLSAQDDESSYATPYSLVVGREKSAIWAAGGTSDVVSRITVEAPDGIIKNESQMIFAVKLGDGQSVFARDKMKSIAAGDEKGVLGASENYNGWYISLQKEGKNSFAEYVSSAPVLINGTLFVTTFIQKGKINVDDLDVCAFKQTINGDSRIYALDVTTGGANLWLSGKSGKSKYVTMEGVKISGLTQAKNKKKNSLLVKFDDLSGAFKVGALGRKNISGVVGMENMVEITDIPEPSGDSLKDGMSVIDYWLIK